MSRRAVRAPSAPRFRRGLRHAVRFAGGVRIRLTLWYLAILALVFVVFGGIVLAAAAQQETATEQAALTSLANQLSGTYDAGTGLLQTTDPWDSFFVNGNTSQTPTKPEAARFDTPFGPTDVALLLNAAYAPSQQFGRLTAASIATLQRLVLQRAAASTSGIPTLAQFSTASVQIADLRGISKWQPYHLYFSDIRSGNQRVATLVVGQPAQSTHVLSSLVPGLLIAGPLTLLIAALGGYWLASRAMRPVRLITRAAEEIEETDLSRRLRLRGHDELSELAATFDRMLARLESAFARQRQFTADASHELRTPLTIVGLEASRALS
ncbi:MAG: HAMP domain-containing protein, partial [Ktedonobacterales bacterium]